MAKARSMSLHKGKRAAALSYSEDDYVPRVVAAAKDDLAIVLEKMALEFDLPVVRDSFLAEALVSGGKVPYPIPEDLFAAVAEVLAYCYRLEGRFKEKFDLRAGKDT